MIETAYFKNNRGQTQNFNTNNTPMHHFEIDGQTRMTARPKMQEHGSWKSFSYLDAPVMHLQGDLVEDTTEDYITSRLQLMSIICPPRGRQTVRAWGTFYLKYFGQELMKNEVVGDGIPDLPLEGLQPTVGAYSVSFLIFDPYWVGVGSGKFYLI